MARAEPSYYTPFTPTEEGLYLLRPYLFMPINVNDNHWVLVLIHRLSSIKDQNGEPSITLIIFDSMGSRYPSVEEKMSQWLRAFILPQLAVHSNS